MVPVGKCRRQTNISAALNTDHMLSFLEAKYTVGKRVHYVGQAVESRAVRERCMEEVNHFRDPLRHVCVAVNKCGNQYQS